MLLKKKSSNLSRRLLKKKKKKREKKSSHNVKPMYKLHMGNFVIQPSHFPSQVLSILGRKNVLASPGRKHPGATIIFPSPSPSPNQTPSKKFSFLIFYPFFFFFVFSSSQKSTLPNIT